MSRTIIRGSLLAAAVALVLFRSYWAMAEDASSTMTIYVSQSGDDDNFDGLTPDTAKKTVAGAIAAVGSASPAEILILPSTTAYTLGTPANAAAASVTMQTALTIRSTTGRPEDVVLKLAGYRMFEMKNADAAIRDVTLDGGMTGPSRGTDKDGAYAVWIRAAGGTVSNCVIRNCRYAHTSNGGRWNDSVVCAEGGTVRDCVITNNVAGSSNGHGPLWVKGGCAIGCLVADNRMSGAMNTSGGGSAVISSGSITGCTFMRNQARNIAGVAASGGTVTDCLVWDNIVNGTGKGDVWSGTAECFVNCSARLKINDSCSAVTDPCVDGQMRPIEGFRFTMSALKALAPVTITFTADAGKASYAWDFDGDGTVDLTTAENCVEHTYEAPGTYSPSVTGDGMSCVRRDALRIYPTVMYVVKGNKRASFPYATSDTAAPDIVTAVDAAIDGVKVLVADGTYKMTGAVTVGRAVTIEGQSGNRDKVVLDVYDQTDIRALNLDHPEAVASTLSVRCCQGQIAGSGVYIQSYGGTVSNCVIRDSHMASGGYGVSNAHGTGARALFTHCWITNNNDRINFRNPLYAGSLYLADGATAVDCLIANNAVVGPGGTGSNGSLQSTVYIEGGSRLVNCTVAGNEGQLTGGVYVGSPDSTVANCVIVDNKSKRNGEGFENVYPGQEAMFVNCATDTVKINETCKMDTVANLFESYSAAAKDYRPKGKASALTDAGSDQYGAEGLDLADAPRVCGGAIDIGAWEYQPSASLSATVQAAGEVTGHSPLAVSLLAVVEGTNGTERITFEWDMDGDGTVDVTKISDPTVSWTYVNAANRVYTVVLTVSDEAGTSNTVTCADLVTSVNPSLRVPDDYASVAEAYAAAIDGCEIVLAKSETPYSADRSVSIKKEVVIRGATGNPADTVLRTASDFVNNHEFVFSVNNAKSRVSNLTIEGAGKSGAIADGNFGGTISNCIIRNCSMPHNGQLGSVYLRYAGTLLTHCVISNNQTTTKSVANATPEYYKTPGVRLQGGARMSNCLVADNRYTITDCAHGIGGVYIYSGRSGIVNCTIVNNVGCGVGGVNASSGAVTNTVIAGNSWNGTSETGMERERNVLPGQADRFVNCATDDDAAINAGCFAAPMELMFKKPSAGDYRPRSASVLFNAGITDIPRPSVDLLGRPRVFGGRIDIGCCENQSAGLILIVR